MLCAAIVVLRRPRCDVTELFQMKTVAESKNQVNAAEIERHVADDRRRHTHRGYTAVGLVTILSAIAAVAAADGSYIFEAIKGGIIGFVSSAITAAYINSGHDVYYRRSSSLRMD
jgi:hypothetical protein